MCKVPALGTEGKAAAGSRCSSCQPKSLIAVGAELAPGRLELALVVGTTAGRRAELLPLSAPVPFLLLSLHPSAGTRRQSSSPTFQALRQALRWQHPNWFLAALSVEMTWAAAWKFGQKGNGAAPSTCTCLLIEGSARDASRGFATVTCGCGRLCSALMTCVNVNVTGSVDTLTPGLHVPLSQSGGSFNNSGQK